MSNATQQIVQATVQKKAENILIVKTIAALPTRDAVPIKRNHIINDRQQNISYAQTVFREAAEVVREALKNCSM